MRHIDELEAEKWLKERIPGRGLETICRRTMIFGLAHDLTAMMKARGYVLLVNTQQLANGIATVLYHNRGHGLMGPCVFEQQYEYGDEYIQHYSDTVSWERFWETWGSWDDVSLTTLYGFYRRLDIQEYVVSQLNHALSPQSKSLEAEMKDPEEIQPYYEED